MSKESFMKRLVRRTIFCITYVPNVMLILCFYYYMWKDKMRSQQRREYINDSLRGY
jgi:preprotein translocase subunit YajC